MPGDGPESRSLASLGAGQCRVAPGMDGNSGSIVGHKLKSRAATTPRRLPSRARRPAQHSIFIHSSIHHRPSRQ